jgi:hypothetical protein
MNPFLEKSKSSIELLEIKIQSLQDKLNRKKHTYTAIKKKRDDLYWFKMRFWSTKYKMDGSIDNGGGFKHDERVRLQHEIEFLEMQDSVAKSTDKFEAIAKENKKAASKSTILSKISKLPEEIVNHIRDFIPLEIRNDMIEQTYNPVRKLVTRLDKKALSGLIKKIYLEPTFFATLSPEKAEKNTLGRPSYRPEWKWKHEVISNMKTRLLDAIFVMKHSHPELLYKVFSTLSILIRPNRRYKGVNMEEC